MAKIDYETLSRRMRAAHYLGQKDLYQDLANKLSNYEGDKYLTEKLGLNKIEGRVSKPYARNHPKRWGGLSIQTAEWKRDEGLEKSDNTVSQDVGKNDETPLLDRVRLATETLSQDELHKFGKNDETPLLNNVRLATETFSSNVLAKYVVKFDPNTPLPYIVQSDTHNSEARKRRRDKILKERNKNVQGPAID